LHVVAVVAIAGVGNLHGLAISAVGSDYGTHREAAAAVQLSVERRSRADFSFVH